MLARLFPKQFDNDYRGHPAALWLLALFLLLKAFASLNQIGLNPSWTARAVLEGVEKAPLSAFDETSAEVAIVFFGWWGVGGLVAVLLGVVSLLRYRAMVPLVYLMAAATKIGEQAVAEASPLAGMLGIGAPTPYVAIALLLAGFALSVTKSRRPAKQA